MAHLACKHHPFAKYVARRVSENFLETTLSTTIWKEYLFHATTVARPMAQETVWTSTKEKGIVNQLTLNKTYAFFQVRVYVSEDLASEKSVGFGLGQNFALVIQCSR